MQCGVKLTEWQKEYLRASYEKVHESDLPSNKIEPQDHYGLRPTISFVDEWDQYTQVPVYTIDDKENVRIKAVTLIPKTQTKQEKVKMENCKYYHKHLETIRAYIGCLYRLDGCCTGGLLHILLDDDNLEDHHIEWCLKQCEEHPENEESEIGKLICKEYLKLTMPQRRLLCHEYLPFPSCNGKCESCYIEKGDET